MPHPRHMALPCGRGVSLALANDTTAPAHLISARDPFRAPRSRVPDGRSLSVGVESPTASAHSNPTQKTLAVRAGQNKFLKDSPKITCPPHQPQNLTKPASPLPISLSQTWHSYPHPTPTIELAPKLIAHRTKPRPSPRPTPSGRARLQPGHEAASSAGATLLPQNRAPASVLCSQGWSSRSGALRAQRLNGSPQTHP
jgi:hypothetical protein